mmetsp:Transcript_40126/g.93967  ORF Transcript_40126/g.93967 Transcript_40126/m.93967 type:complete len:130 (+) Transcript_40126:120-509(+)
MPFPTAHPPFKLMVNITDDDEDEDEFGNPMQIAEGRYDKVEYATACDVNAAAAAALYKWLGEHCVEWVADGVTQSRFEGDESGIVMYTYGETATLRATSSARLGPVRRGKSERVGMLIVQFYGMGVSEQ